MFIDRFFSRAKMSFASYLRDMAFIGTIPVAAIFAFADASRALKESRDTLTEPPKSTVRNWALYANSLGYRVVAVVVPMTMTISAAGAIAAYSTIRSLEKDPTLMYRAATTASLWKRPLYARLFPALAVALGISWQVVHRWTFPRALAASERIWTQIREQ
jgi:hypothetical protein